MWHFRHFDITPSSLVDYITRHFRNIDVASDVMQLRCRYWWCKYYFADADTPKYYTMYWLFFSFRDDDVTLRKHFIIYWWNGNISLLMTLLRHFIIICDDELRHWAYYYAKDSRWPLFIIVCDVLSLLSEDDKYTFHLRFQHFQRHFQRFYYADVDIIIFIIIISLSLRCRCMTLLFISLRIFIFIIFLVIFSNIMLYAADAKHWCHWWCIIIIFIT